MLLKLTFLELENDHHSEFPRYKASLLRIEKKHTSWYRACVYAESICGVAQIIRDPSISATAKLLKSATYIGMPTPYGSYTLGEEMKLLKSAGGFA